MHITDANSSETWQCTDILLKDKDKLRELAHTSRGRQAECGITQPIFDMSVKVQLSLKGTPSTPPMASAPSMSSAEPSVRIARTAWAGRTPVPPAMSEESARASISTLNPMSRSSSAW